MESFTGDMNKDASGVVIEANLDPKRGIEATLLIKDGSIKKGMVVATEEATCSTRIMENFLGHTISEATFSSPVRLVGFDKMPKVGAEFESFKNKNAALEYTQNFLKNKSGGKGDLKNNEQPENTMKIISIVLKADVSGMVEAIEKEIEKIKSENIEYRIIQKGAGPIGETDVKAIASSENAFIVGFNVKADKSAIELAEKRDIPIFFFDIIYKMTEWLTTEMEKRRPKVDVVETTGRAKILKTFSRTKERQIMGGKVTEGAITLNGQIKIMRREFEIGRGKIINLEKNKVKVSGVEEGAEFGMMLESKIEVVAGDIVESFSTSNEK
jgi:translation initiation factor IF-2